MALYSLFPLLEVPHRLLHDLAQPFIQRFGLTELSTYLDLVVYSCLFFTVAQHVIVPVVSKLLSPESYGALKGRAARNRWAVRGVSMIHTCIIIPLALRCLNLPHLDDDRAFGWDTRVATVNAVTTGYFIWDTVDAILCFDTIGFVLHGFTCILIYLVTFRPFLGYYSIRFLLWETSTIFLNIHWFLDKTGQTGSLWQLVNGVILVFTFLSIRMIWGGIVSYQFFLTMIELQGQIPPFVNILYCGGNLLLQGLNYIWFYSMILALKKRFKTDKVSSGREAKAESG